MAVDRVNGPPPANPAAQDRQGPRGSRSTSASRAGSDRIELSAEARLLSSLLRATLDLPAVRTTEVERFREAIVAGAYTVDPGDLARAILEFEDGLHD